MELSRRRFYTRLLLILVALFSVLAVVTAYVFPAAFHMPILVASAAAFVAMMRSTRESTTPIVTAFVVAAIGLNCFMTFVALEMQTFSSKIALAEIILFTGLSALLVLTRTKKKLPAFVKVGIMCAVVFVFIASLQSASEPAWEMPEQLELWLSVALGPMVFLTFMTFLVLVAYHRRTVTMPPHKWQ